jgi:hypothetical protein
MTEALPASCPDVLLWKGPGRSVTWNELAVQLRAAEVVLREVGSGWDARIPARVRYRALIRANAILKVLLADQRDKRRPYGRAAWSRAGNCVRRSWAILHRT